MNITDVALGIGRGIQQDKMSWCSSAEDRLGKSRLLHPGFKHDLTRLNILGTDDWCRLPITSERQIEMIGALKQKVSPIVHPTDLFLTLPIWPTMGNSRGWIRAVCGPERALTRAKSALDRLCSVEV